MNVLKITFVNEATNAVEINLSNNADSITNLAPELLKVKVMGEIKEISLPSNPPKTAGIMVASINGLCLAILGRQPIFSKIRSWEVGGFGAKIDLASAKYKLDRGFNYPKGIPAEMVDKHWQTVGKLMEAVNALDSEMKRIGMIDKKSSFGTHFKTKFDKGEARS